MKGNYKGIIEDKLSKVAKDAINTNEDIQDVRRRRNVRNEIINTVVEHLVCIYRNVGNPVLGITRQIVTVMGHSYPSLFQDKGDRTNEPLGYGLGGSQGIKQLPQHLLDRVRAILGKCRKQEGSSEDIECETAIKREKRGKCMELIIQSFTTPRMILRPFQLLLKPMS